MLTVVLLVGGALVVILAILPLFSLKRKLDTISQSHWELRYEFARLRARVARLDDGGSAAVEPEDPVSEKTGT